jgi:tetratricopeptide (TPR) repeat protein
LAALQWIEAMICSNGAPIRHVLLALLVSISAPRAAAAIQEATAPTAHAALNERLRAIGTVLDGGDVRAAEEQARVLLDEVEAEFGRESVEAAEALDLLLRCLIDAGKVRAAETREFAERAIKIKETSYGEDDPRVATTFFHYGRVLDHAGEYGPARLQLERSLRILANAYGLQDIRLVEVLFNLAIVHMRVGEYDEASKLYDRSITIVEATSDHAPLLLARVLNAFGGLLYTIGDYAGARSRWERALAIREERFGPDHLGVATLLNNLSAIDMETRDFERARVRLERVITIRVASLGPDHPLVGSACGNLATIQLKLGNLAAADSLLEHALTVVEASLGRTHRRAASLIHNQARVRHLQGEYRESSRLFEEVLAIRDTVLGREHASTANTLHCLALLAYEVGDLERARVAFEEALSIRRQALGPEHPEFARTRMRLAAVLADLGESGQALEMALAAEETAREHFLATARTLAEREALLFVAMRVTGLDVAIQLVSDGLERDPVQTRRVWDALIRSRALVLDEVARRQWVAGQVVDSTLVRVVTELATAREQLASLSVRRPSAKHAARLEQSRKAKETAERELARMSLGYRSELVRRSTDLREITSHLPADGALVAFRAYRRLQRDRAAANVTRFERPYPEHGERPEMATHYAAFVIRAGSEAPNVVAIGPAGVVDAAVSAWSRDVARYTAHTAEGEASTYRDTGEALRELVWDPLDPALGDSRHVFVVPDSVLHRIHFAVLPTVAGAFLIEDDRRIHYLTAEHDLIPWETVEPQGAGLLVVGDPDFGPAAGPVLPCTHLSDAYFPRLPATGLEAWEVRSEWDRYAGSELTPSRRGGAQAGSQSWLFLGSEATESEVKARAPGKSVIHLATHGFFLDGECELAEPDFRAISALTMRHPSHSVAQTNAFLLSGLALAGANSAMEAQDGEDGILMSEEIASLDLHGVDLVVLSACDTGVGEVKTGEGVLGIRRAFRIAGARSLVMSLWPVRDEATRDWMRALYLAKLRDGLGTADAVHEASLQLLRRQREIGASTHPLHWGSFISAGDWR